MIRILTARQQDDWLGGGSVPVQQILEIVLGRRKKNRSVHKSPNDECRSKSNCGTIVASLQTGRTERAMSGGNGSSVKKSTSDSDSETALGGIGWPVISGVVLAVASSGRPAAIRTSRNDARDSSVELSQVCTMGGKRVLEV